ncbi:MAG TPA: hypothetical protein VK096_05600, partial [Actinomycetales bacterium]|nr:hypothetical protein [Actinomycetales bacterium]
MSIGHWNTSGNQTDPVSQAGNRSGSANPQQSRAALAPLRPLAPAPDRAPVPASAAWREGDEVGRRQFVSVGDLTLE